MENQTITNKECAGLLRQRMLRLFWKIAEEKEGIVIDGVPGYNEKAQFVGGKVIYLCSYAAVRFADGEAEKQTMLTALRDVIDMCSRMKMETWGILNGLKGLYLLKESGLYDRAVSPQADQALRLSMDWRTFVDPDQDYALIHKPTNYYGVAFGIARYRELMGWEPLGNSAVLLDRLVKHISAYSGEYGFMDETAGEGRFDRYSILIPAEITELVAATGWEEPPLIRRMLKSSAGIVLKMANRQGWGFSYGRSIGAYGETAVLQILASAAGLPGLLSDEELSLAWSYSAACIRAMVSFWYDEEMQSVNMWEKGRRTDGYRNKNRILGENLSLSMQVTEVMEQWQRLGFSFTDGSCEEDLEKAGQADGLSFFRFAKHTYDRGLAIYRSHGHVWSLPLISGGTPYYDKDPYLPVPRENGVLEAVPDVSHLALVPQLILKDGRSAIPACFFDSIEILGGRSCRAVLKKLCLTGNKSPEPLEGIQAVTTYTFSEHEILREDHISIQDPGLELQELRLSFDTFSSDACLDRGCQESSRILFGQGPIRAIEAGPYDACQIRPLEALRPTDGQQHRVVDLSQAGMDSYQTPEDSFCTPHGPCKTSISWKADGNGSRELDVFWKIVY